MKAAKYLICAAIAVLTVGCGQDVGDALKDPPKGSVTAPGAVGGPAAGDTAVPTE